MFLLTVITVGLIVTIIFIPKRISYMEMYTTSFFATFLAAFADIFLDIKLDLYGFFTKGADWQYIPIFAIIYPAANILLLNFFPFRKSLMIKTGYILVCSIVTTIFEYLALQTELFYHNEWKLWYSALCYPVLFWLLFLNLKVTRRLVKQSNKQY